MSRDQFKTTSGLPLADAEVTITGAEFAFNAQLGGGCALTLTFEDAEGGEHEQYFTTGKNFEPNKDGSAIVGKGGINSNSTYGILLDSIGELDNADEAFDVIETPFEAAGWVGTKWTTAVVQRESTNPSTKVTTLKDRVVFVEYHGAGGDAGGGESKPAAKTSTRTAAKKETTPAAGGLSDEQFQELVDLAGEYDDHGDFVDAAVELDWVDGNKDAQKLVMSTKAGSPWAAKG